MKILVSIDDTDNIDVKWGTGELASMLAEDIKKRGWGKSEPVTRHQLLVHPDVPYTSHNSSMCFAADIDPARLRQLIEYASYFLEKERAPGSDPGLCVVEIDRLIRPGWLIAFGYSAKQEVLTKDYAYELAEELNIHLSEHGGTGDGIIGALAGAGLRLSGNDGRFRGKLKIKPENEVASVSEILTKSQTSIRVDLVKSLETGHILKKKEMVRLGETVKPVLLGGKSVLLVTPAVVDQEAAWITLSKTQLKEY
ncbi:Uncharacterized [Syntrophomonas zehnderi OL-4]|uniref:Uncharacterized n=1 Tax=Syntrophomonas zehnderi OL-4 TaxID=690567 RepID=A0A0E4C8E6_9FIRM|nr:hypothetical protein [Syntrophomonas zehnderi]CFX39782.1 Uncharacterized [Syntrophomonas zehnderi OL-4]